MSILLSAKRQHERPSSAFEASLGRGVERERRWMGPVLAWVIGMPLCLLLGAGANYGWHWWHNTPREERIEIRKETPLAYRLAEKQQEFTTIPFPAPAEPELTTVLPPAPVAQNQPVTADPLNGVDMNGISPALAQRFRQAVANSAGSDEVRAVPDTAPPAATPLADLPAAVGRQVPPLRYSSHVYSSTAANRIITLNGHDYHEGEEVAPGVRLLQIQADYSIFRVGGQSFSLPSLTDWSGVQ